MDLSDRNHPTAIMPGIQHNRRAKQAQCLVEIPLAQLCQLAPESARHQQRLEIMFAIRAAMANPALKLSAEEANRLASLARYLCDWPTLQKLQSCNLWQAISIEKILPDIQMGNFARALAKLKLALQSNVEDLKLTTARQELNQLMRHLPYPLAGLKRGAISITPLQFYHVADFGWQYGDSQIAELCNLPLFPSAQHWLAWLHLCQQQQERHLFAVIHQDYGFIGSVSLQVFDGIGFFYYWLGVDFQRQGFGPIAVDILMHVGRRYLGMHSCYAKVFDYNLVSNKAIAKLGFERLPLKALPPSDAEIFYYLGPEKNIPEHCKSLGWLLRALQSGIELDIPALER